MYTSEICWAVVTWIVKYSILAFYWRLFSANGQSTRKIILAFAAFVTCWGTTVMGSLILVLCSGVWSQHYSRKVLNRSPGIPHSLSMSSYQFPLGVSSDERLVFWRAILFAPFLLIHTTHRYRYGASGLSGAAHLEHSYAQVTENHADCHICSGQLVSCSLLRVSCTTTLPVRKSKLSTLADEDSEFRVTVVSIVRLTFIVKTYLILRSGNVLNPSAQRVWTYDAVWSSVEPNMSIVCG